MTTETQEGISYFQAMCDTCMAATRHVVEERRRRDDVKEMVARCVNCRKTTVFKV